MNQHPFTTLPLPPELLSNLQSLNYKTMTPIQAQSLPFILAGDDVIGQGQTGSGKTAAFGLGLLTKLDQKSFNVQALVLCPTRELADQVAKSLRQLARTLANIKIVTLCGGVPFGPQANSLAYGAHIVVGTPGRIDDHLRKEKLKLDHLTMLVLDEADRMLEMGFQSTVDAIIEQIPTQRQTLLFSATYPDNIQSLSRRIMIKPVMVQISINDEHSTIRQHFYQLEGRGDDAERLRLIRLLLLQDPLESTVIFCNMRIEVQQIVDELRHYGFSALGLHGELDQKERDQILVRFANKSCAILVATDVAGRGLDIDALDLVINYQLPRDLDTYIHRIGRTGRAGSVGRSCTLFTSRDTQKLVAIEDYLGRSIKGESEPRVSVLDNTILIPEMITVAVDAGKKQKIRPGDLLGALTSEHGIFAKEVGKIHIFDYVSYVAVHRDVIKQALAKLNDGKLKKKNCRAWVIRG